MSNLLGIGASGVRAYQSALTVVGENIANAGTAGYVRRDIKLTENAAIGSTGPLQLSLGNYNGVDAKGVTRAWDAFKATAVRTASSDIASTEANITYLSRVESALSSNAIGGRLTSFFNAATALAADPSSASTRAAFLTQADAVATSFRGAAGALDTISGDILADARDSVDTLNGLAASLAQVNATLPRTRADSASAAALMDQRDAILDKMSSLAGLSVTVAPNGTADVRLGSATGPLLVDGMSANRVSVSANDAGTLAFTITTEGTHQQAATISGGALAGLSDAALRVTNTIAGLDEVANSFAAAVNGVQAGGVDRNGDAGKPIFTTRFAAATPLPGVSGGADVAVSIAADATPSAEGYVAAYDGATSQWTVSRLDGTGTPVSGTGTLAMDGLTLTLGGVPKNGDSYRIDVGSGARGLNATSLSPSEIAAAAAWTADAPITNAGTGAIAVRSAPGTTGLPALPSYRIDYDDGQVTVTDPATDAVLLSQPYATGMTIAGAEFSVQLTGVPRDGDSFTLIPTGAGSLDNSNLAAFDALRATGAYESRADALASANAATLGSRKTLAEAQAAIRDNAVASRDSEAGVNLDNEAVDLLRFQQAYQASSRIIQVAREVFQNLLDVV